ncbi:MAG: VOC family protein [Cyanobacteria bacterium P01_A01_bin.135]
MSDVIFHLAFPVTDIAQAKAFYGDRLGCDIGRGNDKSVILNLYGHQLVAHLDPEPREPQRGIYPRHFGLVFTGEDDFDAFINRIEASGIGFHVRPKRRFEGTPLEHRTFFLADPFHNLMEFKYYCHPEVIFGGTNYSLVGET